MEFRDPFILDRVGMVQCNLIPTQGLLWVFLKARHIMGGNAGVIIVLASPPGLLIKAARIFHAILEFGTRAF
ncbi:MAG: hypothetical protein MZV65_36200, partial [Chromatiales bacterium]|nr:hypothetical protein [Chromatiales bacterium]